MPSPLPGPLTQEVAALIRARMARLKVSGVDLANLVDVSQSQLSKITRGLRDIDIDLLDRVCTILDLRIDELLTEAVSAVARAGLRVTQEQVLDAKGYHAIYNYVGSGTVRRVGIGRDERALEDDRAFALAMHEAANYEEDSTGRSMPTNTVRIVDADGREIVIVDSRGLPVTERGRGA